MNRRKIEKIIALAILASMLSITTVSAAEVTKDESVYVNLDSSGKLDKITVSDWLHSTDSNGKFEDESELDDIKNVKSDEKPSQSGKSLSWKVDGSDLYYQGTTDKELPLDVEIKYYLDDKEMKAEDLKGESGKLRIELQIKNKESRNVTINGKDRTIYTPFTTATAITLPNDKFLNVTTSEGTLLSEGNNNIVGFVTFPGLKDSLDLDSMNLDLDVKLDDKLVVEADVENFALAPIMITATPELPDLSDLDYVSTKDELSGALNQLKDASDKLLDGTGQLKDSINLASTKLIDAKKLMNSKSMQEKLSLITSDRNVALANKLLDDADFAKDLDTSEIPGLLNAMNNTLIPLVSPTNINFGKNLLNDANGLQNKYGKLINNTMDVASSITLEQQKNLMNLLDKVDNLKGQYSEPLKSILTVANLNKAKELVNDGNTVMSDYQSMQGALALALKDYPGKSADEKLNNFLKQMNVAIDTISKISIDNNTISELGNNVKEFGTGYLILKS
ncbi:MAG: hypothetical protein PUE01_04810, partial [Clostridiaceae bacterium]|nr:hypothetical protein [Clostridiaceae bacterium]